MLSAQITDHEYGLQVLWDCRHHRCLPTTYRADPACRFDHQSWSIDELRLPLGAMTLGDLLSLLGSTLGRDPVMIQVAGQSFAQAGLYRLRQATSPMSLPVAVADVPPLAVPAL